MKTDKNDDWMNDWNSVTVSAEAVDAVEQSKRQAAGTRRIEFRGLSDILPKILIALAIVIALLFIISNVEPQPLYQTRSNSPPPWYEGGTLHNATMGEWYGASYENRLATCADICATIAKNKDVRISDIDTLDSRLRS